MVKAMFYDCALITLENVHYLWKNDNIFPSPITPPKTGVWPLEFHDFSAAGSDFAPMKYGRSRFSHVKWVSREVSLQDGQGSLRRFRWSRWQGPRQPHAPASGLGPVAPSKSLR